MSNYHIVNERVKLPNQISQINGTVSSTIQIFHRVPVIDNMVRSPISGKLKTLSSVTSALTSLKTNNLPTVDGRLSNSGTLHLLLPGISRSAGHTTNWHGSINNI